MLFLQRTYRRLQLAAVIFVPTVGFAGEGTGGDGVYSYISAPPPAIKTSFSPVQSERAVVDQAKRDLWIGATLQRLKRFRPTPETAEAVVKTNPYGRIRYWIDEEALVRFGQEEWLYIVTHSAHLNDGIGSATLAVDHAGNFYLNDSHFCDRFSVHTSVGDEFRGVTDFLTKNGARDSWRTL